MKFVQTFWTGTASDTDKDSPLKLKAGWYTSEYHWMSWALSCLQLLKLYGQVELVTDRLGKEILIDTLGLPYTSVSLALEGELEELPTGLFSLAKIKTYSLQKEPFIHVDGDLFLFQPLPPHVLRSDLVSSNPEADLFFNAEVVQEVTENGYALPDHLKGLDKEAHLFSSNAGIIGGHDLDFIKEYCNHAFDFVSSNKALLRQSVPDGSNFLIEQMSFFYMARKMGKPIAYVSADPVTEPLYHDFIRVADIPDVPMVHAVGGCKRFPFMLDHLAKRLRLHYPEYYYRILALCKEQKVKLSNSFYQYHDWQYQKESDSLLVSESATDRVQTENSRPLEMIFERTIKVLEYTQTGAELPRSYQAFRELMDSDQVSVQCKDMLQLELLIDKAGGCLRKEDQMAELYAEGVQHYRKTVDIFNAGMSVDTSQRVVLAESALLYTASWNWWKDGDDAMEKVLSENFVTEPEDLAVAITPEVLTMDAYVYYLDALDAYLVEVLKSGEMSLATVLQEVSQAFEEEIDPETNMEYRYLIFDTIKRLAFNRIISFR